MDATLFEIWEEQMVLHGNYIFSERKQFVERFIPMFQQIYSFISEDKEKVGLVYKSQLDEANLAEKLLKNRERDRIIGFSMNGIHKDELEMSLAELKNRTTFKGLNPIASESVLTALRRRHLTTA